MICWRTETILTLAQAAASLPYLRGRPVSRGTVWRWAHVGRKGVKLETLQVGGVECTSAEAMQRFFDALSPAPEKPTTRYPIRDGSRVDARLRELLGRSGPRAR